MYRHGMSQTAEYKAWSNMIQRCNNPNDPTYKHYGARGITMTQRWQGPEGFTNFIEDMGLKPSPEHTIDRINNDDNYYPDNCQWSTMHEQTRNRRSSRHYTHKGKTQCLTDWAKDYNICPLVFRQRLDAGWSFDDALTTPVRSNSQWPNSAITINGKTQGLQAWCKEFGISKQSVKYRLKQGWSIVDALTTQAHCKPA